MKSIDIELSFNTRNKVLIHLGNYQWLDVKSKTFAKEFQRKYKRV